MTSRTRAVGVRGPYHSVVDDRRDVSGPEGGLTHNPFAALRKSSPPRVEPDALPVQAAADGDHNLDTKAGTLRLTVEQAGRKGKTVTRLAGLRGGAQSVRREARDLARALGCGWSLDGEDVLLQGDQAERAARQLENGGATRVVRPR
jgi:translation initiation factor 1